MELTSKPVEKMTKIELIETVNLLRDTHEKLKRRSESEHSEQAKTKNELNQLRAENQSLKRQLRDIKAGKGDGQASAEENDLLDLVDKHRTLEKQYKELLSSYNKIKNRLDDSDDRFAVLKSEFDRLLEVKRSFSDSDQFGHILIDYQYVIRFINKNATIKLKSKNLFDFIDQKIFKLFDFDNGMKVKKQIDKVMRKEKMHGSLKNVIYSACDSGQITFRSEINLTRFRNKPAVLFTFK